MASISVNFRTIYTVYCWTLCGGCNIEQYKEGALFNNATFAIYAQMLNSKEDLSALLSLYRMELVAATGKVIGNKTASKEIFGETYKLENYNPEDLDKVLNNLEETFYPDPDSQAFILLQITNWLNHPTQRKKDQW